MLVEYCNKYQDLYFRLSYYQIGRR